MMNLQPWQANTLQCLAEFSNLEQQRSAWVGDDGSHFPSPVELICQLFNDTGLGDLLETGCVFSDPIDNLLRTMRHAAAHIDLSLGPTELLADDAWLALSKQAARAHDLVLADLSK